MSKPIECQIDLSEWEIFRWKVGQRRMTRAVGVRVHFDAPYYFAENTALNIIGTGMNQKEAFADFLKHLDHFRRYYAHLIPDQLTGEAVRLKQQFHDLFVGR